MAAGTSRSSTDPPPHHRGDAAVRLGILQPERVRARYQRTPFLRTGPARCDPGRHETENQQAEILIPCAP
jgi:hypothetical protein